MHKERVIDKNTPLIKPLWDTWRGKQDTGTWGITAQFDFSSLSVQEINAWYINSMMKTLDAFSELARVWRASFSPSVELELRGLYFEWKQEDFCMRNTLRRY
jgi:hypothetical protein